MPYLASNIVKNQRISRIHRFFTFKSVFSILFASVMLALILFAIAMVLMTHLLQGTNATTRHQVLASQVTQQVEPLLENLKAARDQHQRLETRYLLALLRRSFSIYSESVDARFGLYNGESRRSIMLMEGLPPILPPEPSRFSQIFLPTDPHKPVQIQTRSPSGYIVLYESNNKSQFSPAFNLITGTLLLLVIMSGMLWFIARTMTWRINQLSRQMTQFGEGNFSARVTPSGNDEISTLANGFNLATQRIESLMNANKLLLAHASHEIRTPITRIRLQVEMMSMLAQTLDKPIQEKIDKRAEAINRDLTGLNDLVESILLVSRLDAGHALDKMATVDLYELIKGEVQHYPQVSFIGQHVSIVGQSSLLTHLIRNLLDNAHLHGTSPVSVALYAIDSLGHQLDLPLFTAKIAQGDKVETLELLTENLENKVENTLEPNLEITCDDTPTSFSPACTPYRPCHFWQDFNLVDNLGETTPDFTQWQFSLITQNPVATVAPTESHSVKKESTKDKLKSKAMIFARKKTDKPLSEPLIYNRIRIAVIDQGEGIALDKREEIFGPFVRLKQEKKGSGLGLSLVSQIVAAHHGKIITDTLDGHTRFLVTLPVEQKLF